MVRGSDRSPGLLFSGPSPNSAPTQGTPCPLSLDPHSIFGQFRGSGQAYATLPPKPCIRILYPLTYIVSAQIVIVASGNQSVFLSHRITSRAIEQSMFSLVKRACHRVAAVLWRVVNDAWVLVSRLAALLPRAGRDLKQQQDSSKEVSILHDRSSTIFDRC